MDGSDSNHKCMSHKQMKEFDSDGDMLIMYKEPPLTGVSSQGKLIRIESPTVIPSLSLFSLHCSDTCSECYMRTERGKFSLWNIEQITRPCFVPSRKWTKREIV